MTDIYAAALALADRGIPVFPCLADKSPAVAGGFHAATFCPVADEWRGAALIGMPTGDASGLDCLDIDPRHGGDTWLKVNRPRLPATVTVPTRSGGLHIYFRAAPGLRCSAGRVAPGVDVRAAGGYAVLWRPEAVLSGTAADWPEWLADAARGPRAKAEPHDVADLAPPNAEAVVALLDRMPNTDATGRDEYLRVMMAAKGCADGVDEGADDIAEAAVDWAARWPGSPGRHAEAAKWQDDFAQRDAPLAGWPQLLAAARRLGVDTSAEQAQQADADFASVALPAPVQRGRRMRDRILRPADCETGPRRGYIIKGLLAPGDVGAIIGPPGCGKSQLAPLLAYAVAQGCAVFGCRTKPGGALYVAAEDFTGMQQRVYALKLAHGDAPGFALVDCANLGDEAARADLFDAVKYLRPALVIIDTLGAAWAGLDENDAAGMGAVVALARRIAATGAAVLLVHHTAKNGDGSPRGHSVLNGTLDMCLALSGMDEHRIIRGTLTKNRNGPCDLDIAFRSGVVVLGVDDDDDDITAPIATALAANLAPQRPKLSGCEQRALDILAGCGGAGVSEETWHDACEEQRLVASDVATNRRKTAARAFRSLVQKQAVEVKAGLFHLAPFCRSEQRGTARNSQEQAGTEFRAVPAEQGTSGTATLKGCSAVPFQAAEGLL